MTNVNEKIVLAATNVKTLFSSKKIRILAPSNFKKYVAMKIDNSVYEKSNQIPIVALSKFRSTEYNQLLKDVNRQKDAQSLINYLCDKFYIPHAIVKVVNTPQPHATGYNGSLKSKTLGTYNSGTRIITMYNITAVKKQVVSIKTFMGTLLHEFMHHYDYTFLKFNSSPHTAGFYKRISDIENKLSK